MHGRSDGVLNIRGIRIGPAEIYPVLQDFPEVAQALAVAQQDEHEPGGMRMVLLVTVRRTSRSHQKWPCAFVGPLVPG